MDWLRQYGGYVLIATGAFMFSLVIPSAAGPADALPRQAMLAPPTAGSLGASAPLLIASSNRVPVAPAPVQTTATSEPGATIGAAPGASGAVQGAVSTQSLPAASPALEAPSDRIVIARIGLDVPVVDVGVLPNGEMETAAYAVGRLTLGADAGDRGNVVLAGHNDVLGEVFRRLPELQEGDEVALYRAGKAVRYRVEGKTIVREHGATDAQRRENARWMDPTDDSVATLISCYPYRVDTHRYIVRARLIDG